MAQWQGALEMLGVKQDIWQGRSVLITGHTGFKGGWLALWLEHLGAKVTGLGLPPDTTPSLFEKAQLARTTNSHLIDIRNAAAVRDTIARAAPEIIFHLAAQPLVRRSYREPAETFATNVMGTVNLLDAARDCSELKAIASPKPSQQRRKQAYAVSSATSCPVKQIRRLQRSRHPAGPARQKAQQAVKPKPWWPS